ncbi:GNAT family N-acetyltransferase [Salinigranum sp. GCM10025319]|uniref:GNAT family N-acetyltransferase n=1 Tax=Salinigranum sp. GCM10025319 TaxID=3252687 RepID=UPI0036236ADE
MSSRVRRAVPADAETLRTLQRHLDSPAPELLDAALSGALGDLLVAVADAPVGYLLAVDGGPSVSDAGPIPGGGSTVHVAELVVAPAARRQGHASALLATLLSERPSATVTLTVEPGNGPARSLYDRFGFEVERELPGFFDDGPGLLLVRRPRPE